MSNTRAAVKSDKKRGIEYCPAAYEINRILDTAHDIAYRLAIIGERDGLSADEMRDVLLADEELIKVLGKKPKRKTSVFDWIENYLWNKDINFLLLENISTFAEQIVAVSIVITNYEQAK